MTNNFRLGIDIGGTKVNIGIIGEEGNILDSCTLPSGNLSKHEELVANICRQAEACLSKNNLSLHDISHIGVGIPGTANYRTGVVRYSPNLFKENVPLGDYFEQIWQRKVTVLQDSWAGAWAEYLLRQDKDCHNMLCITLGTGIGCGVVLQGKVFGGVMQAAGEIGHTSVVPGGRLCSCGKRGCLEAYTSGTAIWEQAKERFPAKLRGKPEKAETVFQMAYDGDSDALSLLEECVDRLAYGLTLVVNLLSVNVILVSGGICNHEKLMIAPLAEKIRAYGYPAWAKDYTITVKKAALGSFAPMVGAAFLTEDCIL